MAKIELKHLDCVDPKDWIKAEVSDQFISTADCIRINGEEFNEPFEIILDKSTAIRFAKTLRTEINKIEVVMFMLFIICASIYLLYLKIDSNL